MLKKLLILFTLVSILFSNEHNYNYCKKIFIDYSIDPKIKSVTGWKRVIYQKKLKKYFPNIPIKEKEKLKNCLIHSGMNLKKFNRSIGGKK